MAPLPRVLRRARPGRRRRGGRRCRARCACRGAPGSSRGSRWIGAPGSSSGYISIDCPVQSSTAVEESPRATITSGAASHFAADSLGGPLTPRPLATVSQADPAGSREETAQSTAIPQARICLPPGGTIYLPHRLQNLAPSHTDVGGEAALRTITRLPRYRYLACHEQYGTLPGVTAFGCTAALPPDSLAEGLGRPRSNSRDEQRRRGAAWPPQRSPTSPRPSAPS